MTGLLASSRLARLLPERRQAPRHLCSERPVVRMLLRPSFERRVAVVRNLSASGACLHCTGPFRPSGRLALWWDFGPWWNWRILSARIVYADEPAPGTWAVGCEFDQPLTEDVLDAFLAEADVSKAPRRMPL
jgi:PilZ domain